MNYKEAIEWFDDLRKSDANAWGVFFLGTQVFMGKTRVYATDKTARARVVYELDKFNWRNRTDKEQLKKVVQKMEQSGMLEIRKIGDRSPKFHRNVRNVETDQVEKFEAMLDASDEEMVKLAITILDQLKDKK